MMTPKDNSGSPATAGLSPFDALEAACGYALAGWRVLPLRPRGKVPLTPHGCLDATADFLVLADWWADWPGANIGIATGPDSGLVVIDLDGDYAADWLHDRERRHGEIVTPRVITGAGGIHLYLRHPGRGMRVKTTAGQVAPGVDVRGDGGYVVAPPSVHRIGTTYEWEVGPDEVEVAPIPAWLDLTERPAARRPPRAVLDRDELLGVPSSVYVPALTGLTLERSGKVCCPFHDDSTPSLQTYDDADRGWYCYGCNVGGSIIDFGSLLYWIDPTGPGYEQVKRLLSEHLR